MSRLVERLRERAEILDNEWDKTPVFMDEISNDYLEAATELQAYEAEIERLRAALKRLLNAKPSELPEAEEFARASLDNNKGR